MDPIIAEAPLSVRTPLSNYRACTIRGRPYWDSLISHLDCAHAVVPQDSGEEEAKLFITYVAYEARLHYQPGQSDGHISRRAAACASRACGALRMKQFICSTQADSFFSAKMGWIGNVGAHGSDLDFGVGLARRQRLDLLADSTARPMSPGETLLCHGLRIFLANLGHIHFKIAPSLAEATISV